MAIQEVNVGTIPNDGTGDDPRTGISKVNSNFTDTTNMAAQLAQTSTTDTTTLRGVTTDVYQPSLTEGLGVVRLMNNNSGGVILSEDTIAGSSITFTYFDVAGAAQSGSGASGTWKNVSARALSAGEHGFFMRVI